MTYRLLTSLILVVGTTFGATSLNADHGGGHIYVNSGALCQPWSETNLNAVWTTSIVIHQHGEEELIVTSCRSEAPHRVLNSLHRSDRAVDVTWEGYTMKAATHYQKHLIVALGPDYDIVVEKDHLHIEFDP